MDLLIKEKFYWKQGIKLVGGIDEAGRGPLAGPVVAACVILNPEQDIDGIKDSKKLSDKKRRELYEIIINDSLYYGIGIAHESEIDKLNVLQATFLAMKRAIGNVPKKPEQLLVDGPYTNIKLIPVETIIKGDSLSKSIAAASILAKVTRDNMMVEYDKIFPGYNLAQHKGYGTKQHIQAIEKLKSSPLHRQSFKIVKNNMPSFSHYINSSTFSTLGFQYVGCAYIRNNNILIESFIEIEENGDIIDCLFKKDDMLTFVKIISIYDNKKYSNGNTVINNKSKIVYLLEDYIIKKELTIKSIFNVIFVEFKHKNKPKINIEFSAKLN